jgi:exportin-T
VFDEARHRRDGLVRDAVRERDAPAINQAVTTIVAAGEDRLRALRAAQGAADAKEIATTAEVVDWGVRTFGSYVGAWSFLLSVTVKLIYRTGWIDISLTVTPDTVRLLFTLLSDPSLPIRLATALALTRITAKGLKEPGDKLQLIKVLALGQVIDELEKRTREEQRARGKEADEDEESFREALGRLLNQLGVELMKLVEVCWRFFFFTTGH